jgi:hypothetical protein
MFVNFHPNKDSFLMLISTWTNSWINMNMKFI